MPAALWYSGVAAQLAFLMRCNTAVSLEGWSSSHYRFLPFFDTGQPVGVPMRIRTETERTGTADSSRGVRVCPWWKERMVGQHGASVSRQGWQFAFLVRRRYRTISRDLKCSWTAPN